MGSSGRKRCGRGIESQRKIFWAICEPPRKISRFGSKQSYWKRRHRAEERNRRRLAVLVHPGLSQCRCSGRCFERSPELRQDPNGDLVARALSYQPLGRFGKNRERVPDGCYGKKLFPFYRFFSLNDRFLIVVRDYQCRSQERYFS